MRRCKWCGKFVRADAEMTVRVLLVARSPKGPERRVAQMLCPECSAFWSHDTPHNRPGHERPDLPLEVLS